MEPPKIVGFLLIIIALFHIVTTAKQAVVAQKSKICGNAACDEVLFKSRVKRVMGVNNDPNFLNLEENAFISVVAVKFSDRPDIMEGKLNDQGSAGFFYAGAIDIAPFAEFLRAAIDEKKEMLLISQNPSDPKRVIDHIHSEQDLVRDYNAKSAQAAAENGLPPPTPLPIPEPPSSGHGHSHGGHGHSHGGHGHSHSHPAPTPEAPKPAENAEKLAQEPQNPEIPVENAQKPAEIAENAAPEAQKSEIPLKIAENPTPEPPKPEIPAENAPKLGLNNVLGGAGGAAPEKIDMAQLDDEIERMIRQEEENLKKKAAEEQKQPDLVLSSIPVAQEVAPNDAPKDLAQNLVETPAQNAQNPAEIAPELAPNLAQNPVENAPSPTENAPKLTENAPELATEPVQATPETPDTPAQNAPNPAEIAPEPITTTTVLPLAEPIQQYIPPTTTPIPVAQEELTTPPTLHEAPPTSTEAPPPISAEEEEFIKWEEERRKKREAENEPNNAPYEDAQSTEHFKNLTPPPRQSSQVFEFLRAGLGLGATTTDSSILLYLNFTFVMGSLLVYVIVRSLSSGGSDSDVLDRQAYFELVTKYKETQLQIQSKNAEIQRLQQSGAQNQHEPELQALRQQLNQLHSDLHQTQSRNQELELHFAQFDEVSAQKEQQIAELTDLARDYTERLEKSASEGQEWSRQLEMARSEVNDAQRAGFEQKNELESQIRTLKDQIAELQEHQSRDHQSAENAAEKLKIHVENLKLENSELKRSIEQLEKELEESKAQNAEGAESGGSGWSDFGDEEVPAEKTQKTAENLAENAEFLENLEKIRVLSLKLKESEENCAKFRELYEKEKLNLRVSEHTSRAAIEMEVKLKTTEERLQEAKQKLEEVESRNAEMFKLAMTKSTEADQQLAAIRAESIEKDKKMLELESQLRGKDEKLREMDSECKRVQREYTKLETKSFHDTMKLKKELDDLKTTQILGGPTGFSSNLSTFDAENRGRSPLEEPIWDEPEGAPGYQPFQPQPENRRRSSRRSHLEHSDMEISKKKEPGIGHRRRSRSQGRPQIPAFHDPFSMSGAFGATSGGSDSSFISNSHSYGAFMNRSSSGRLSKNNMSGHYSSGGSNGGRSPPPEMPLLSAIPPPGARKPMSKRPDSHHAK